MPLLLLFLTLMAPSPAGAAVYKWVDEQGQTQYSDQPHPNAEEVKGVEIQTYEAPPPPPPVEKEAPERPAFAGYEAVEVLAPENDETIWDNTGNITVRIGLSPALQAALGHKVVLMLNGERVTEGVQSTEFHFSNLDRGSHTVQASVVDEAGQELAASTPITFHLKKHSVLLP